MSISTDGQASAKALRAEAWAAGGVAAGCSILTMEGELPVEYLMPGDRLITRNGVRRLRAVEVTVLQNARMVRFCPHVLGQGRPAADLLLRPDQPVLIRDWRAKALYGQAQALVPAARLVDGEHVRAEVVAEVRLFSLHLDAADVIYAGGVELLSGAMAAA